MTPVILDASALLAIALDEPGADAVVRHMVPSETYIHAINAFEVATKLMAKDVLEVDAWSATTFGGAVAIDEAGSPIKRRASRLKSVNQHLSLGDASVWLLPRICTDAPLPVTVALRKCSKNPVQVGASRFSAVWYP